MQLGNKVSQQCPCCHTKISFKELFSAWAMASKNDDKLVRCPHCQQIVQELAIYEKYGLLGGLPLFGVPLVFSSPYIGYIVGLSSLVYIFLLFWLLYIKIPLVCQSEYSPKKVQKEIEKDSRTNQYVIGIIAIVFFVSIMSMLFSFATTMKEKNKQKLHKEKEVVKIQGNLNEIKNRYLE